MSEAATSTAGLSATDQLDTRRYAGYPMLAGDADPVAPLLAALTTEATTVLQGVFLTNLRLLEADIAAVRDNADTAQAAVWYRNANELAERQALFFDWQKRMCGFLGLPLGPQIVPPASGLVPGIFVT